MKLACIPNFSFLGELEVTFPGGWGGWVGGWLYSDNRASLSSTWLALNLPTGTELGKTYKCFIFHGMNVILYRLAQCKCPYGCNIYSEYYKDCNRIVREGGKYIFRNSALKFNITISAEQIVILQGVFWIPQIFLMRFYPNLKISFKVQSNKISPETFVVVETVTFSNLKFLGS